MVPPKFKPLSREIPERFGDRPRIPTGWASIGDSSVTGAVANPRFHVTAERTAQMVGDLIIGKTDQKLEARVEDFKDPAKFNILGKPEPLVRTLYTRAEFDRLQKDRETAGLLLQSQFSLAFDTEEYAFPYLIGRALKIPAAHIVLAAQDGKKVSAIGEQLQRLLEIPGVKTLPPVVVASFVANDMCHPDNFEKPLDHFAGRYAADLKVGFDRLAELPPAPQGTRVIFVAPLNVSAILSNPDVMDQKVEFENAKQTTCRSIHDGSGVHGDVAKKLQTLLLGACRGILKPSADPEPHLQRLRDMQAKQLEILKSTIAAFNKRELQIRVQLATSASDLKYQKGDVANDCFHPSAHGHERIAERLLNGEFKDLRSAL